MAPPSVARASQHMNTNQTSLPRGGWRARIWRTPLLLGAVLLPALAFGQNSTAAKSDPESEPVKLDAFVTTGTRIGTAASQSDMPVTVVSRAQFEHTSFVEVADLLKTLPAFTGAGNLNDSSTNGGDGSRYVDLRGLGSQYTLVLLNGRRLAYSGVQNIVNVNQIPVTAVERVEVLASGASAVYGTDAIGGVINVITRKMNGGELSAYYGDTDHQTALSRRQFALSWGGSEGRIDFVVGAQYYKQNGIYSSDFDWSRQPGTTGNNFPYTMTYPNSLFTPGATGSSSYVVKWKPSEGGPRDATTIADFRPYNGKLPDLANPDAGGDMFPFFLFTPLIRPEERWNVSAFTNFHLNDDTTFYADVMYNYSYSYNQLAPAAQPMRNTIVIPATNYWNQRIFGASAVPITTGGWRLLGLGTRIDTNEVTSGWFNFGVKGKIRDWRYELSNTFTQENRQDLNGNGGSITVLNQLLALTTPDAFNPFTSNPATNAGYWGQIRRDAYTNVRSRMMNTELSVHGPLFAVPAGEAQGALTVNYQNQSAYSRPDAQALEGSAGWNRVGEATEGSRRIYGAAAELQAPLTKEVSLRVAGRWDHYSDFGNARVWQAAARYQPAKELVLRASFGKGYIAPSILQLYEGEQETNPTLYDPTTKNSDGTWGSARQIGMSRIGNRALKSEQANSYNAGFAWSPPEVRGLTVSVDYYRIEQKDVIASAESTATRLIDEFWSSLGATDAARDAAARIPARRDAAIAAIAARTGIVLEYSDVGGDAGLGGIDFINRAYRSNLSLNTTEGVDVNLNYVRSLQDWGNLTLDWNNSFMFHSRQRSFAGAPDEEFAGSYSAAAEGGWPKFRSRFSPTWTFKALQVTAAVNYLSGLKLDDFDSSYDRDALPSWTTYDAQISYQLPWFHTTVAIGCENIGNKPPQQTSLATNNDTPAGLYDVKGRYYYARLTTRF